MIRPPICHASVQPEGSIFGVSTDPGRCAVLGHPCEIPPRHQGQQPTAKWEAARPWGLGACTCFWQESPSLCWNLHDSAASWIRRSLHDCMDGRSSVEFYVTNLEKAGPVGGTYRGQLHLANFLPLGPRIRVLVGQCESFRCRSQAWLLHELRNLLWCRPGLPSVFSSCQAASNDSITFFLNKLALKHLQ